MTFSAVSGPPCGSAQFRNEQLNGPVVESTSRALLRVVRFIMAGYETDCADCWDAAFGYAEATFGPDHGPVLAARCAMLARASIRAGMQALPAPCVRLTSDEALILAELAGRGGELDNRDVQTSIARLGAALKNMEIEERPI